MRKDLENLGDYRDPLAQHGVTPKGVSWANAPDLATRFEVLLEHADLSSRNASEPLKLLDLGCGPGFLLDWLAHNGLLDRVDYTGVDVTEVTMRHARERWPGQRFEIRDVREQPFPPGTFDFGVVCGVFTGRGSNTHEEMLALVKDTLMATWPTVRNGLAFNVMSKHVDWEGQWSFHWALDDAAAFLKASLSRHVSMRLDYGLWETAVSVMREPLRRRSQVPGVWSDQP